MPSCTFLRMLSPSVATTAAAVDRGVGDLLDAVEVAGEAGRDDPPIPRDSANSERRTEPTLVSLGACPASSAFVESARRTRMPSVLASWPMRARSVRRPSTGVRSSLKSPVCRMTPCGVCTAIAWACGTLWVTGMNSTSNGPICTRSPSATACSSVLPSSPASSMRLRARPSVSADPYTGTLISRSRNCDAADVVLVTVRGDDGDDPVGVLAQVREVRQHEVDPVHVGIGEHQPAVDQQQLPVGTVARRTAADLDRPHSCGRSPQSAEEDDPDRIVGGHGRRVAAASWPTGQPRAATRRS